MKKTLALICSLVMILSAIFVPGMFTVTAATVGESGVIATGTTTKLPTWSAGSYNTGAVTFDTPLDCSGSNGYLKIDIALRVAGTAWYKLKIYTSTVTTSWIGGKYAGGSADSNISKFDESIALTDIGLTDEDLKSVTGYRLEILSHSGDANYADYTISFPRAPIVTDTLTSGTTTSLATWSSGSYNTGAVTFDTPLDCSGSNGYLKIDIALRVAGTAWYKLKIYTSTVTTSWIGGKYAGGSADSNISKFNESIALTDIGLTDEDLKSVTGYQLEILSHSGDVNYADYTISFPKAPIVTNILAEGTSGTTGNYGQTAWSTGTVTLDAPLDCSGSDGTIHVYAKLSDSTGNLFYKVKVFTADATSSWIGNAYAGSATVDKYISLADIGLTDDNLKRVTGYTIEFVGNCASGTVTYKIDFPRPAIVTNTLTEGTSGNTGNYGQTAWSESITFDAPLDCSGSDGTIHVYAKLSDSTGNLFYKVKVFTADATSSWIGNAYAGSATVDKYISLADIGLTDDNLKRVIGYTIEFVGNCSTGTVAYKVDFPRPAIKDEVLTQGTTTKLGPWFDPGYNMTETFDVPKDCSGSNGYLSVKIECGIKTAAFYKLKIYTKTATTAWIGNKYAGGSANANINYFDEKISLADIGLTDEDLKGVTGYSLEIGSNGSDFCYADYKIHFPRECPEFASEDNAELPTDYVDGDLRFMPSTTVEDVISYYPYAVITNGEETVAEGLVKPGMTITLVYKEEVIDTARVIVYDDLDMDGNFSATDLTVLRKTLLDTIELNEVQLATIKYHGYENTYDIRTLVRMKKLLVGLCVVGQVSTGEWKADKFYLSSGRAPTTVEGLANYKELGYNMAEVQINQKTDYDAIISAVDEVGGIDVVVSDTSRFTANNNNLVYSETSIRKAVALYNKYNSIIGYKVFDEILPTQYSKAQEISSLLNKFDPNSLKFINLLPSYHADLGWDNNVFENYVSDYIDTFNPQVLSFDYYPYLMGTEEAGSNWWRDLGLFRKKSIEENIPLWYYYQGYKINEKYEDLTNEEIKNQMYVGLAYGAKQLSEWVATRDGLNADGTKTDKFDDVKVRNAEVMAIGNLLFDKKSTAIYQTSNSLLDNPFSDTEKFYLDDISDSDLINDASYGLILSVFEDENAKYLLVVNRDTENAVTGSVLLDNEMNISKLNKTAGTEDVVGTSNSISLNIAAGGGEVYILK